MYYSKKYESTEVPSAGTIILKECIFVSMAMETTPKRHLGRNVRRVRDMIGVSQEALADKLGKEWSQKRVSLLEEREEIEDELLRDVAKALEVPADFIRQFGAESIICNIQNNYEGSNNRGVNGMTNSIINFSDELSESYKKIEELQAALLKEKDERIAMMQKMIALLEQNKGAE